MTSRVQGTGAGRIWGSQRLEMARSLGVASFYTRKPQWLLHSDGEPNLKGFDKSSLPQDTRELAGLYVVLGSCIPQEYESSRCHQIGAKETHHKTLSPWTIATEPKNDLYMFFVYFVQFPQCASLPKNLAPSAILPVTLPSKPQCDFPSCSPIMPSQICLIFTLTAPPNDGDHLVLFNCYFVIVSPSLNRLQYLRRWLSSEASATIVS